MKEDLYDDLYLEEKEEKTDFKAILFKYAIHWPWFVACTLLCIAGAWLYLRYTPPVYNISASVIIKDNDKNSKASSGMGDLEDLGFYSSINNLTMKWKSCNRARLSKSGGRTGSLHQLCHEEQFP